MKDTQALQAIERELGVARIYAACRGDDDRLDEAEAELQQLRRIQHAAERHRQQSDALFSSGARLALELECLLLSCKDTAAVSKWWDSAHDALEMWRQAVSALEREPVSNADEFDRALRLADDAAESVICTEGRIEAPGVWRITRDVLDSDRAYLSDCLEHLRWRGLVDVETDAETGDMVVGFRGE